MKAIFFDWSCHQHHQGLVVFCLTRVNIILLCFSRDDLPGGVSAEGGAPLVERVHPRRVRGLPRRYAPRAVCEYHIQYCVLGGLYSM